MGGEDLGLECALGLVGSDAPLLQIRVIRVKNLSSALLLPLRHQIAVHAPDRTTKDFLKNIRINTDPNP